MDKLAVMAVIGMSSVNSISGKILELKNPNVVSIFLDVALLRPSDAKPLGSRLFGPKLVFFGIVYGWQNPACFDVLVYFLPRVRCKSHGIDRKPTIVDAACAHRKGVVRGKFCDPARQRSKSGTDFLKHIGDIQPFLELLDRFWM